MRPKTVGVVGLGNMGGGIARNFAKKRVPLMVWDISEAAMRPFERMRGVEAAEPGRMARECAAMFFVVPGTAEIAGLLGGKGGVLANARRGLVLYDFTSSDPAASRKLARRAARRGVAYLDAGMSGGASGAEAGTLTLMIGGEEAAFRRTRALLRPIAARPFYLGASGAGHTLKLIHNMVCHTIFLATCEGGKMAERAGIRLEDMIAIFNVANARSYASEVRFPRHILSGRWDARSRVYNLHKDVGMAVALGRRLRAGTELGAQTHAFLEKAMARGMVDSDFSLLYRDFDEIRKTRKSGSGRARKRR